MKKLWLFTILFILFTGAAYAGPSEWLETAKAWASNGAILAIISFVLGLAFIAKYTNWISAMLVSVGKFMTVLGLSLADRKLTKEEWNDIHFAFDSMIQVAKEIPVKDEKPDGPAVL